VTDRACAPLALEPDPALADQEIDDRPDEGQRGDQEQPCQRHSRRRPHHDDSQRDDDNDRRMDDQGAEGGR